VAERQARARKAPAGALERRVREILAGLGEDPTREGLQKTPERVA